MSNNRFLFTSIAAALALISGSASAAPVVIPEGVDDALPGQGTGLCSASAISTSPTADFGLLNPAAYVGSINAFMEAHKATRLESVIRTLLDLSNNNSAGLKQSYGDFVDAVLPLCQTGGCDFPIAVDPSYDSTMTAFGMRLRGYFNVTGDLANKPIHFGFYTDDAVSLTFYGANAASYPILTRPAEVGFPVWRVTEQGTFKQTVF